ncbi:unnamed protein product, partial [marine sediment metagenome]
ETFLGRPNQEKICRCLENIGDKDPAALLDAIDDLLSAGQTCVQIADSLIDYFRDMMVIKSTNPENKLLILTAEERKKISALAAKFDVPALIYSITTLEKIHFSIKNSDNPRALLEALMLRLALSEHFLAVPQLLARLNNSSAGVRGNTIKKKPMAGVDRPAKPATHAKTKTPSEQTPSDQTLLDKTPSDQTPIPAAGPDAESIIDNWQQILSALKAQHPGTAGLLDPAVPTDFRDNVLTLSFPELAEFAKTMCQNRADQIKSLLTAALGFDIKIRLETATDRIQETTTRPATAGTSKKNRDDALNDP